MTARILFLSFHLKKHLIHDFLSANLQLFPPANCVRVSPASVFQTSNKTTATDQHLMQGNTNHWIHESQSLPSADSVPRRRWRWQLILSASRVSGKREEEEEEWDEGLREESWGEDAMERMLRRPYDK